MSTDSKSPCERTPLAIDTLFSHDRLQDSSDSPVPTLSIDVGEDCDVYFGGDKEDSPIPSDFRSSQLDDTTTNDNVVYMRDPIGLIGPRNSDPMKMANSAILQLLNDAVHQDEVLGDASLDSTKARATFINIWTLESNRQLLLTLIATAYSPSNL